MSSQAAGLLEKVRERRSEIFKRFSPDRLNGCTALDVRRVIVIDAASRSGSSVLHHLLSRHPGILSLNGEGIVFEKLHGLGFVNSAGDSDFIPDDTVSPRETAAIAEDMLGDAGTLHQGGIDDEFPRDDFLADSVQRLILQYPEIDFRLEALHEICARALAEHRGITARFSASDYWLGVLRELRGRSFAVDPGHYDLRGSDPAADFPSAENRLPPPFTECCLEEPPFVVPQPRRFPTRDRLAELCLLLKSSSDSYHLWLIKKLFPNARFKFVVLTRNPAGAISGLMDGWLSNGFYSRNVERVGALAIRGYSNDRLPWTTKWWNFDLPPGWADFRTRALEEVCGLQWSSANEHILRDIGRKALEDHILVRYESILEPASLARELARILEFAGLGGKLPGSAGSSAQVMSVTPPAPQKWRKRRDAIAPLVLSPRFGSLARELGYDPKAWENWP